MPAPLSATTCHVTESIHANTTIHNSFFTVFLFLILGCVHCLASCNIPNGNPCRAMVSIRSSFWWLFIIEIAPATPNVVVSLNSAVYCTLSAETLASSNQPRRGT
ncbi:hypothetical protein KP509_07G092800 [Ceratopteris richardii]|uniref:Uncharacterized protein n=1 Tax=Ceratopteris richardii TaxID=49495 RepID=A0A8T2UJB5_CERRI|nr:hypothetical protein KP509_07G092800 [Ceratopteris richardii]